MTVLTTVSRRGAHSGVVTDHPSGEVPERAVHGHEKDFELAIDTRSQSETRPLWAKGRTRSSADSVVAAVPVAERPAATIWWLDSGCRPRLICVRCRSPIGDE
jgi:hypothetical protein